MFELTRKTDYGLRLMLEVAAGPEGSLATAKVARQQEIPYQFLRKVAQELVAAGLLTSERGGRGGLSLARPAEAITVLDIVKALGPVSLNRCTVSPPDCDRRDSCACYPLWVEAQAEVERVLAGGRLSDLVRRHRAIAARHDDSSDRRAARGEGLPTAPRRWSKGPVKA